MNTKERQLVAIHNNTGYYIYYGESGQYFVEGENLRSAKSYRYLSEALLFCDNLYRDY